MSLSLVLRTIIFAVLMPGTVAVYVPWLVIASTSASLASGIPFAVGAVLVVVGAGLAGMCIAGFMFDGGGTPAPYDPPRRLVTGALYRRVRNPMYLAMLTVLAGQALVFASWPLAAWALFMWLVFHAFVVFYEEPTLHRLFGATYDDYRRRVPRWLPR